MVTKDLEEKSLRELILAFDDGLSFKYWLTHSGIPSLVKLRTLRAQVIADFINGGMLITFRYPVHLKKFGGDHLFSYLCGAKVFNSIYMQSYEENRKERPSE